MTWIGRTQSIQATISIYRQATVLHMLAVTQLTYHVAELRAFWYRQSAISQQFLRSILSVDV